MQRERREWMANGLVLLGLALAALGCAKSESPADNGQTHWLEACRSDAECGELSCVCGLCTEPCSSDSACGGAIEAECVEPARLPFASCEERAPAGLCVPECGDDSDCSELSDGLSCSDGLCRPQDMVARDSSVPMPDANVMDADSGPEIPDSGSIPDGTFVSDAELDDAAVGALPVLVCAGEELDRTQAPTVEVIAARGTNGPAWTLAAGGLVYRADPEQDDVLIYGASSEPESFAVPQTRVLELVTDGDALYYGAESNGLEVIVGRIDLDDSSHRYLAREDQLSMDALVLVPDGLLFMAGDGGGTTSLYRIGREPGASELLAVQQGRVTQRSLVVLGSSAYYLAVDDSGGSGLRQLHRVSTDASSVPEALGEPTPGLDGLITDGLSLFADIGDAFDSLGNPIEPQGVVRVSAVDGSLEMLHEMDLMGHGGPIVSGTELYFTGQRGDERGIFRAHTTGEPQLIADIDASIFALVEGEGYLYVALFCGDAEHVLRFPKP